LEHHADPVVTPLHVVAPWYLSWSQGWLKLAPKTVVIGFIPALLVLFIIMPYFEVGKSRRYADRRVGLSVSMLFIAFMMVSNWMGTPRFRVQSSADLEVATKLLPEEGVSSLLGIPPEFLWEGQYLPGETVAENPHLTYGLEVFAELMVKHSCTNFPGTTIGGVALDSCEAEDHRMPDPYATLTIRQVQEGLMELVIHIDALDPENTDEYLYNLDWVGYRHADSNYEEECSFINKSC